MWYIWALFVYGVITPRLMKKMGMNKLLCLALFVSFICGIKFVSNDYLDAQRVVHFYPFYVIGMWLRTKESYIYKADNAIRRKWLYVFLLCNVAYFVCCYIKPGFCYGTGFMGSHGRSIVGFACMWMNFILTLLMSCSVIMLMPNKKLWFTKYGSRTMNVYLLHMSIIFPLCWYLMRPIMNEWYGYILYIVVVPILCLPLFSKPIDKVMVRVLSLPDKLFSRR